MDDPDERLAGLLGNGLAVRLDRWVAEARVDEAVRRRSRERWLAQQAREEATLVGVLADLAERGALVSLHLGSGPAQHGCVRLIGADFVAIGPAAAGEPGGRASEVVISLRDVAAVRTRPGARVSAGDRRLRCRLSLAEVVTRLAAERERVLLVLTSQDVVRGALWSVGEDVVVVRAGDEPNPATVYVPLGAICQLSIG